MNSVMPYNLNEHLALQDSTAIQRPTQPAHGLKKDRLPRASIQGRAGFASAFLFVLNLSMAGLSGQDAGFPKTSSVSDRIVFTYAGKPVYCQTLTGLPYMQGLNYVRQAYKYYTEDQDIKTEYSVTSSEKFMDRFKPPKNQPLEYLYNWQISSAIALFIGAEIFQSLTTNYPVQEHWDLQSIDIGQYLAHVSIVMQSRNENFLRLLLGSMPPADFLRSRNIERKHLAQLIQSLPKMRKSTASYFIKQKCFPCAVDNHPAPWLRCLAEAALVRPCLSWLFFENRDMEKKYLLKVINRDPEYRVAYVRHLEPNSVGSMETFLCGLSDSKGCIAVRRFMLFRNILREMGSPVAISIFPIKRSKLCRRFHIGEKNIVVQKIMRVPSDGTVSRGFSADSGKQYVFIFGRNMDFSLELERELSSAWAAFCREVISKELDRVLRRIKIEPPFMMPSYDKMVEGFLRLTYFPSCGNDYQGIARKIAQYPRRLEKVDDILWLIDRRRLLNDLGVVVLEEEDLRDLLEQVDNLCGSKLVHVPSIGFYCAHGMQLAIRRCAEDRLQGAGTFRLGDLERFGSNVSAFYDPKRREIFVNTHRWVICKNAKSKGEIRREHDALLLHELVHAWQYEKLPVNEIEGDNKVLDSLLEGHACWCVGRFISGGGWGCCVWGDSGGSAGAVDMHCCGDVLGFAVRGYYVDGLRFIGFLARQKPKLTIQDVFKRGLPTQRQLVFPDEYVQGFRPELVDFRRIVAGLVGRNGGLDGKTRVDSIDFMDMRLMLYRSGFTKVGIETACRNYRGGRRIKQPGQVSVVLAFAPTRHDFVPVYIRRCTSEILINREVRKKHGHRLDLPEAVAATTDAWITPAWDEQRGRPAKAKDGKPLPSALHAVFAGKYLYIRSEWKTVPKSDKDALKVLAPFVDRCRKADAECAKFFKDESGDDEWN